MYALIVGEHMELAMLAMPPALDIEQRMALYFGRQGFNKFLFFPKISQSSPSNNNQISLSALLLYSWYGESHLM
jgi:hypothetical protein